MKRIFGIAVIAAAFVACNSGETTTETTGDTSTVVETPSAPVAVTPVYSEGDIISREGKVYVYTNGDWVLADKEVKLDNGIIIKPNGEVTSTEGKVVVLQEGEYVNRTGNFFDRTGAAIENGWDATKRGVSNAAEATKEGIEKGVDATEKAAEKTGEAIKTGAEKTGAAIKKGAQKVDEKAKKIADDIKN